MDKQSMILGWLMGRQIAGMRNAVERKPVAYLYNGVQLPALPEWDKEAYPYAVLSEHTDGDGSIYYRFVALPNKRVVVLPDSGVTTMNTFSETGYKFTGTGWVEHRLLFAYPIWANYDVYRREADGGALYLAASDPVPVYE